MFVFLFQIACSSKERHLGMVPGGVKGRTKSKALAVPPIGVTTREEKICKQLIIVLHFMQASLYDN